jgi:hypothetical protein
MMGWRRRPCQPSLCPFNVYVSVPACAAPGPVPEAVQGHRAGAEGALERRCVASRRLQCGTVTGRLTHRPPLPCFSGTQMITKALEGNYVNFGVFVLYGDKVCARASPSL